MKARVFAVLCVVAGLALVLTLAVTAQGTGSPVPRGGNRSASFEEVPYPYRSLPPRPVPPAGPDSQRADAPAVTLGQPGLSFRYVQTFGVTEEPYPADGQHLNVPNGMYIDGSNNLYVVEENGHRMLKFNSSGFNLMSIGRAGNPWHHDNFLSFPRDVAVDASGNIWILIYQAVKAFDSSGNLLRTLPATDPWMSGTANDRFDDPRGIAFDASGRLYVSDGQNHRIQVYEIVSGAPVYSTTIGVTGVPKTDNSGFNYPRQIAFDNSGRLYVADAANYRIQRCVFSGVWTCSTFFGETGVPGSDLSHLEWAPGITIRDDALYIADGGNYRVLKCNTSGTCSHFAGTTGVRGSDNAHFWWPADVAVDSVGSVYVSDTDINHRIQKYNSSGTYLSTIGVNGVPYLSDTSRYNKPWGISVVSDGSLFVAESMGWRLIKMNSAGVQQLTIGQAGVYGSDNAHFGDWWGGLEGNVSVDAAGRIYIPDTGNHRVQIFSSNGAYFATMGVTREPGADNSHFECPAGVAISPVNGDIFVVDRCNQRIQVFNSNRVYKATLGVTDVTGSDSTHFNWPWGVAVDAGGNVYVADSGNYRVQKCTVSGSSGTCATFAGETGVFAEDFGHLSPIAVTVDSAGRVYVADEWNNRVQVFDSGGAYLTTIGGSWGVRTGELRGPAGVAVDNAGNVYVTEYDNHRIQKFAPGVPGWRQSNINGFGDRQNTLVLALAPFGGQLYAGTYKGGGNGAQLWRKSDGGAWTAVLTNGFGITRNVGIDHLIEFNGNLYAGTWADEIVGGEVWRSNNGLSWTRVVGQGFGDPTHGEVFRFAAFNNQIYAGTWSYTDTHGIEIWRSSTGNGGDWTRVVSNGFDGDANNTAVLGLDVFNGNLYAGTLNSATGGEVWRSSTGASGSWSRVNTDGFGDVNSSAVTSFSIFGGYLYAGVANNTTGGQVWRCAVCDGSDWSQVVSDGFGNPTQNNSVDNLSTFENALYAMTRGWEMGMRVWRTTNGTTWAQVNSDGFGDSNNRRPFWDNSVAVFDNSLFVGTINWAQGGEVWQLLRQVYLPAVMRNYP